MGNGDDLAVERLDRRAVAGLVVSVAAATLGLFLLPTLRSVGLSFWVAFGSLLALEFAAFLGVAVSVLRLYEGESFE